MENYLNIFNGVTAIFSNIFYIIIAIAVLLFMVTVHELGHYIAGKILKFKINEFAIGFGPAIFKRKSKNSDEVYSLRAIPLGGFCAFEGEDEDNENPHAFNNQKPWKRIIVLLAGVTMNFLVSFLIAVIVFSAAGMYFPSVGEILPDDKNSAITDPSYILKEGDVLLSVNGKFLYLNGDLGKALSKVNEGELFKANIVRDGVRQDVTLRKRSYNYYQDYDKKIIATDENGIPIKLQGLGILQSFESYNLGFFESVSRASTYCFRMAGVILEFFGQLITGQIGIDKVGGPITTIDTTVQVARQGLRPLMEIVTLIGVNLAVFNLLPIPALDGSRIIFTIIEWVRKKPVKRNIEAIIHLVGIMVLFGFVILADLLQIFGG